MERDEFWSIIETARAQAIVGPRDGLMSRQAAHLAQHLSSLSPGELVAFHDHFQELVSSANHWDLWAVAHIIGGGCSEDWFDYFRYWLVSLGRAAYEQAVRDPSAVEALLHEYEAEDIFFEEISYVAPTEYRLRTGADIPLSAGVPSQATGAPWSDETDLQSRFPQLWAKYSGQ
jgi:hypothetical protein